MTNALFGVRINNDIVQEIVKTPEGTCYAPRKRLPTIQTSGTS